MEHDVTGLLDVPGAHRRQRSRQDATVRLEQPVGVYHTDLERRRPDRLDRRHAVDGEELVAFLDPGGCRGIARRVHHGDACDDRRPDRQLRSRPRRDQREDRQANGEQSPDRGDAAGDLSSAPRRIGIHRAGPRRQGATPREAVTMRGPRAARRRGTRSSHLRAVGRPEGGDRIAGHSEADQC